MVQLDSIETYKDSVRADVEEKLQSYFGHCGISMADVKEHVADINAYPHLNSLRQLGKENIHELDPKRDTSSAEQAILSGRIFWEHTAAGEATRLGLGSKYLQHLEDFTVSSITSHILREKEEELLKKGLSGETYRKELFKVHDEVDEESIRKQLDADPSELSRLSLGERHMLQLAFEIRRLAERHGQEPERVLARQSMLVVVSENSKDDIIESFRRFNFFGFSPERVYFMVQHAFHGMSIENGGVVYDESTEENKRLHNHGQMMMQKAHDDVIFRLSPRQEYLTARAFEDLLKGHDDLVSFNIEDLSYLTHAIDMPAVDLALELKEEGYHMTMEVVSQNPTKPQKGGACFYDPMLGRAVMIESNQLKGIKNEEIEHLNKNVNHYPEPAVSWRTMKDTGLPITFDVKSMPDKSGKKRDYIYPCPVQGDMNFLVDTAYVMRTDVKPIKAWKSPATTPAAVNACYAQDQQEGFGEFVESLN